MPFSFRRLSKRNLLAVGLMLVITLTTLAFGLHTLNRTAAVIIAPVPVQDPKNKERIPTLAVTLTRFGFQPAALKLPEGKFLLVVRNISGRDKLQLELAEVRGQKLIVEKPREEKRFWEKPLNLKAGEYTLSVTENPRWSLALTVVPVEKK
jgi:hypothetical protein